MTDPIGTAQERELLTRLRKYGHIEAADALQSRIAEVGRLEERMRGLSEALEPFAAYYSMNDCHERSLDDALEVPIRALRDAALSLQRRV